MKKVHCGKGSTLNLKGLYMETKKGSSNGYPLGIAEEPFKVLDSMFFSKRVYLILLVWVFYCTKAWWMKVMTVLHVGYSIHHHMSGVIRVRV